MENTNSEKDNLLKPLQVGKIVEGKVINKGRSAVYFDLGPQGTGIIYGKEFQEAKNELKTAKIGDIFFAKIVDLENEDGYIELSLSEASQNISWERLRQMKDKNESIKIKVLGANKGGILTEVSGIPAFLPVSQLMPNHYPRVENGETLKILKELQKFIGEEMEVKIFDIDPKQDKLILSEKAKENEKIKETLKKYEVGSVVEGEITGVTDFGAFVKFGEEGIEGLIHISELDWQLIENPTDIVKAGDKIQAKIISIVDEKVSLSLKALKTDPWDDIETKYKKEDTIKGKVTKFNPYGAFIQIEPKIQGLCFISEFGSQEKMQETLKINETYNFEIILIDPKNHKMSLKLKI